MNDGECVTLSVLTPSTLVVLGLRLVRMNKSVTFDWLEFVLPSFLLHETQGASQIWDIALLFQLLDFFWWRRFANQCQRRFCFNYFGNIWWRHFTNLQERRFYFEYFSSDAATPTKDYKSSEGPTHETSNELPPSENNAGIALFLIAVGSSSNCVPASQWTAILDACLSEKWDGNIIFGIIGDAILYMRHFKSRTTTFATTPT